MKLFVLGVNHQTAPVDIREKVSFSEEQLHIALLDIKAQHIAQECTILSTCNRTEIYGVYAGDDTQRIVRWLHQHFNLPENTLTPYLYEHQEIEAVKHMMRVSAGLNSLVLGEPQILGQMKNAYAFGHKADSIHHTLENLFQYIFKTAKHIRTHTEIGACPISVAFSAVSLAKQFFGDLSQQTALMLGAGETIELVARHLKEINIGKLIIANRTFSKAHHLAELLGGYAIELSEIPTHLHEADIIIGSTSSPKPLLFKDQVEAALEKRRHAPMILVDIAVPRDMEPSIHTLNDTYLYTVDDLQEIIEDNKKSRQNAAQDAEKIVLHQASVFYTQYKSIQQSNPVIQQYREHAYQIKEQALSEAMHQLETGHPAEEVITKLANQLTNKLLHIPTAQLHHAGKEGQSDLIQAAKNLLLSHHKKP